MTKSATSDLVQRCQEILEWQKTGLLKQGGAINRMAASLMHIPESYRLSVAEKNTQDEAMRYVIEKENEK